MLLPVPYLVLFAAIISVIVVKIMDMFDTTVQKYELDNNTIFVVLVSFRSKTCVDFSADIVRKAKHPSRLRIVIIEYIGHPSESAINILPDRLQNIVHVHTIAISSGTTLAHARAIAIKEYYQYEKICLFLNEINIVRYWDDIIVKYAHSKHVLSIAISKYERSVFPILELYENEEVIIKKRKFQKNVPEIIPTVSCPEDVIACSIEHANIVLLHDDECMRNAELARQQIETKTTSMFFGSTAVYLKKSTKERNNKIIHEWLKTIDLTKAGIGLTTQTTIPEGIAKYGSLQSCRLAISIAKDHTPQDVG